MGRRQRMFLRSKGLPTDTPKPPPPKYRDSPRPFTRPWAHYAVAWKTLRLTDEDFRGWPVLAVIFGTLSFLGFGYGRWWQERR